MSISSISGQPPQGLPKDTLLQAPVQANLSGSLTSTAISELPTASATLRNSNDTGFDPNQVKAALQRQLSADVTTGKITSSQATQIALAFERLQQNGPSSSPQDAGKSTLSALVATLQTPTVHQASAGSPTSTTTDSQTGSGSDSSQHADTTQYLTNLARGGLVKITV